jgi:hypothetical protein
MNRSYFHTKNAQSGSSVFGNIVVLLIFAYGIYVGVQYVPIALESSNLDSIFNTIQDTQLPNPVLSTGEAEQKVSELLNINEMNDMKKYFKYSATSDSVYISLNYQRELDLLFMNKTLNFDKSVTMIKPRSF